MAAILRRGVQAPRALQAIKQVPVRPHTFSFPRQQALNPSAPRPSMLPKRRIATAPKNRLFQDMSASHKLSCAQMQKIIQGAKVSTQACEPEAIELKAKELAIPKIEVSTLPTAADKPKEEKKVKSFEPITVVVEIPEKKTFLQKAVSAIASILLAPVFAIQFVIKKVVQAASSTLGLSPVEREPFNIEDFRMSDEERARYSNTNNEEFVFNPYN